MTLKLEEVKEFFEQLESEYDQMNIYGQAKVVFSYPSAGYDSDIERAKKYLVLLQEYDVWDTVVENCTTGVYLTHVKDENGKRIGFNSCHFSTPKDNKYWLTKEIKDLVLKILEGKTNE